MLGSNDISLKSSDQQHNDIERRNAETHKRHSLLKNGPGFGQENAKVVGNSFRFFKGKPDPRESRYTSDEEEAEGDIPLGEESEDQENEDPLTGDNGNERMSGNVLVNGVDVGENGENGDWEASDAVPKEKASNNQGFTSLIRPNFFGRNSTQEDAAEDGKAKTRKIFTIFRKKTKESKKHGVPDIEEAAADEPQNAEDAEARERAQALLSSLSLGSPAINLLASCLCEDEYGITRAPLLLSLLGLNVTDISDSPYKHNRKFRIDLEYGVAPQRLRWSVEKNVKDLLYLHSRFKLLAFRGTIKSVDLPKYPVPPSLRRENRRLKRSRMKSLLPESTNEPLKTHVVRSTDTDNHDNDHHDIHSILTQGSLREHLSVLRHHLSAISSASSMDGASPEQMGNRILSNQIYVTEVTKYLNDLNAAVGMRPQSNRLFHFFEVSPISSLLSYETGYTGKQGVIHVGGTAKSQGWRVGHFKANDLKGMIDRRSEKWFLVRQTYVMYVSDINSTVPLEVFLVDSKFKIHYKGDNSKERGSDSESDYDEDFINGKMAVDEHGVSHVQNKVFQHLRIVLENSERKLVVVPKSEREQKLWIASLTEMQRKTVWAEEKRFGSFAPVRKNCYAQWFVDGRDYFWAVSSALEMAKDVIFIHDWWLSPEVYLRRPANGNQQFRLDRILQRKAQQGVKIFVILYRNVGTTIPIDSLYSKHSILSLNQENIHVIRSPNQLLQNTYFWAHHEKICAVDYSVAFLGGIDLCFGRYDTADHVLSDDSPIDFHSLDSETLTEDEFSKFRVFPGKDYSNTRVKDFTNLDKPYETLYDRTVVPRMPWHDIHMVTSGEAARDLSRHFVQRWNYLLRQKRPSRLTPLLTPPPDLTDAMIDERGLGGSCEVQMVRSAGNWSLGLQEHEESIHTAYLKLIEASDHFVYIENQFFITSCEIEGTVIVNRIGDALVDRIIRAHNEGRAWKAIILVPLVPGFESLVDKPDGSSVRVVLKCEYMSISRGGSSLFAKLRKYGIDPDNYIQLFSLRKWGMLGPDRTLASEVLYIHSKLMIVDDRAAIIGSANINERSMRGSRDSEVAAVVRDTEMISSTMNGEKYMVGKFPHTLRLRLMREHLGVAVDILDVVERKFDKYETFAKTPEGLEAATENFKNRDNLELSAVVELASRDILNEPNGTARWKKFSKLNKLSANVSVLPDDIKYEDGPDPLPLPLSFNNRTGPHEANKGIRDKKKHSYDARVQHNEEKKKDVYGYGPDKYRSNLAKKARLDSTRFIKELSHKVMDLNPNEVFLPDIENVRGFLEIDDQDLPEEMDKESEEFYTERNRERWLLLKKIAYLQRVAAKETQQGAEEASRRAAAGLPSSLYENDKNAGTKAPRNANLRNNSPPNDPLRNNGVVESVQVPPSHVNKELTADFETPPEREAQEKDILEREIDINFESVPIITLDEQQTRETIRQINLPGIENFSKFIDPYGFEDPLDPDFYEDIWFENARRNTEIFRLVFHCQPDDQVLSWKDYKHFMKMENAFKLAQTQEARDRKEKFRFDEDSTDTYIGEKKQHDRRSSVATINMSEHQGEKGIFGDIPSTSNSSLSDTSGVRKNTQRQKFAPNEMIAEHDEEDEDFADAVDYGDDEDEESATPSDQGQTDPVKTLPKLAQRKRRAGTFSARRKAHAGERIFERDSAERLLQEIHGHLVLYPTEWLLRELEGDNWFYNTDRIPPIEIYN